jgi:Zn ribbon nucleic-acid-binding protein
MSSNFQQFKAEVGRFADEEVPAKVRQVQQKIGLQALRGVVNKTPVDTGRARGNWQASIGQPASGTINDEDPSGQAPLPSSASTDTFFREQPTITNAQPFSVIWLSNNLPYIERLENGYSQQAPNGMVSTTVTEIQVQFQRVE